MGDLYIDACFSEAAASFRSILKVDLTEDPRAPREASEDELEVSAYVNLSGAVSGSLMLIVTEQVACRIFARFTRQAKNEMDDIVMDALVELVNILGGKVCGRLEKTGVDRIHMSCPDIALGRPRFGEGSRESGKTVQKVFRSELGLVTIEVKVVGLTLLARESVS